jgi:nicotinamidase-related amidase/catechol 2,3-dioxygenase-like lactoylglutathione lyase family enzyme
MGDDGRMATTVVGAGVPPLLQKLDCIRFHVADLGAGLSFYRDRLGHELIWQADCEAGLRLPGVEAELVLQTRDPGQEIDVLVASADAAAEQFRQAGGAILVPPFDIRIGRAAVVQDPWGNRLVLLDASKGTLVTDAEGRIVGNAPVGPPKEAAQAFPRAATPRNTALLVVDVTKSCADPHYEDPARDIRFGRIRAMIPSLASFIASFQRLGGRVVLARCVPWREPFLPDNLNELYRENPRARYWSAESSGDAEEFYGVPTQGAQVVSKSTYDAFASPELIEHLERARIRYVVVAGVYGDGCVLATICGGFARGYHIVIACDLVETTDAPERQAIQDHLKRTTWPLMYGPTLNSAAILAGLSGCA